MKTTVLFLLIIGILCSFFSGCSEPYAMDSDLYTSDTYLQKAYLPEEGTLTQSLFPSDLAVLPGDNIEKILDSKIGIPQNARLAIIRLKQRPYTWWSEDFTQLDQASQDAFVEQLQKCQRLSTVSMLPSLITPEKKTIPYLREAAARYQADLLIVYRPVSRFYAKYRFFNPEEVKAECQVEAILIDVKTGIVPFAVSSSQQYQAQKSKEDYNFQETYDRAEIKAAAKATEQIAEKLAAWLNEAD